MFITIKSACVEGIRSIPVNVEASATPGLPQETIIGLPDQVIKESRNRIKSALHLSGFSLPAMSYVINLCPTDVIKRNTSLELAMSVALLHVTKQLSLQTTFCFIGSLSLDGRVLPARQILPMVYHYPNRTDTIFIISNENIDDISPIHGLSYIPISHLNDLRSIHHASPHVVPSKSISTSPSSKTYDHIIGHNSIKKACAYAIVGQHPMLLVGPPGIGKTMLIDHMKSIMPPLNHSLAVENTCIESLMSPSPKTTYTPPFRAPHHSITYPGMLGGKNPPQPGEITRANHGILFLDELGEYHRAILDTLREPMETKSIALSRAGHSLSYPANFLLVAAMNPCHCGHYFNQDQLCQCPPSKIKHYWHRISQPLLDRISICCILSKPRKQHGSISHDELLSMVNIGQSMALKRNPNGVFNQSLTHAELNDIAMCSDSATKLLDSFFDQHHTSIRGQTRMIKLSRTVADAQGCDSIESGHAAEAIQLSQHHQLPF